MAYNHKEAFCLMDYRCDGCGHKETIWNSRDGVTPFGTQCPSCGEPSLLHVNWRGDRLAPDHKLHKGQRFWRNGTQEEAVAIMQRRIDRYNSNPQKISEIGALGLIEMARKGEGEFREGWPQLDRHPD